MQRRAVKGSPNCFAAVCPSASIDKSWTYSPVSCATSPAVASRQSSSSSLPCRSSTRRRASLDHAIVLDDKHLRRLLSEYLGDYHRDRTHLGVEKDAPVARPVEMHPAGTAAFQARRRVGGLYHRYEWSTAA
jgi:hypothetical protein